MPDILLAQDALPPMDGMYWLMLLSRILHILSAIVLVGGLFYLWAVVTPSSSPLPDREGPGEGSSVAALVDHLFGGRRAAWAKWVGIASALLLITGLWNFVQMVITYKISPTYHMLGALKILLALVLMLLASLLAGRTAAAEALRRNWRRWLTIGLIVGVLLVMMGSVMRTFNRTLKPVEVSGPTLIAP